MAPTAIETLTSFGNTAPIAAGLKVALNTTSKGQPLAAKKARPAFDALPLRPDHPYASAWGLYGDEDQLGTLNALGPELVWQGLSEVRTARVFSLALPLTVPRTPMNPARQPPKHNLICKGHANDDTLTLNTQASSHWDGLRHYPYQRSGFFYNGTTQESSSKVGSRELGVQNLAERPIVTSAALIDFARYASVHGIPYSAFTARRVTLVELELALRFQNSYVRPGDVLLIRFGWTEQYLGLSPSEQEALGNRTGDDRAHVGVDARTDEVARWIWDKGMIAVASDTNAFEAQPFAKFGRSPPRSGITPDSTHGNSLRSSEKGRPATPAGPHPEAPPDEERVALHEVLLSGWGMPIGELWDLEDLADECARTGQYRFCLSSAPINLPGGVASPPNAIAIL